MKAIFIAKGKITQKLLLSLAHASRITQKANQEKNVKLLQQLHFQKLYIIIMALA